MKKDSPGKKRSYLPPSARKLNLEQANQYVAGHTKCSDREAMAMLESLQRELEKQKEK
jgi:hypothetical protein